MEGTIKYIAPKTIGFIVAASSKLLRPAPQDGPNSRQQLSWIKGLSKIIVSPNFEANNPIHFFIQRAKQNYWRFIVS